MAVVIGYTCAVCGKNLKATIPDGGEHPTICMSCLYIPEDD